MSDHMFIPSARDAQVLLRSGAIHGELDRSTFFRIEYREDQEL
jgi:hypothetical protein